ncbi:redoxin domain-containing protein [Aequorivita sp. CIP111184]|uniref:redoxin domain-containing protein n=1 Tax=Aequorivita sp. CIP111184 TaxID=2211356 RepID=UPI000DBC1A1A|nr:redoxin domain-containing protein [Aequorivita sp. CIP111184]SRX54389.1 Thioredoxin [Aequorivita sp. CIP111184]
MKLLPVFIFFIILQSCSDKKGKTKISGITSEVALTENLQVKKQDFNAKKIISINFEEFEKNYFQKENDSVYIINFWATWCKPCVEELPAFEKIASDYAGEKVKVLLVSLDFPDKIKGQVIPFIKKNKIQSEVVLLDDADANGWIPKVSPEWSGAIPATVIYKKDKRKFYEQSFTFEKLETELKTFL